VIYIHVPFCRSFCTYCDFYSEVAALCRRKEDVQRQESRFQAYADALSAEINARSAEIDSSVNTLYIGGGTPSVLPLDVLSTIVSAVQESAGTVVFDEFTVEVNPEDIVEKGHAYVEGLLALGVNRISMGIQSFDDEILKWMNRRHDSATAVKAYQILEDAGVENISIDLIFGLPQISGKKWKETLRKALEISARGILPRHISSYQLSVEPGSMLAKMVEKGRWEEADEEVCSRQYDVLCETLSQSGYHHYEISNFALPGSEALHNGSYWEHLPYCGFGPGAHSFITGKKGEAIRQWNKDDLDLYLRSAGGKDFSEVQERELLTAEQLSMEQVMLSLRTSKGMKESDMIADCDPKAVEKALSDGNLIRIPDNRVRIPESRFFLSDRIISDLL